MLTVNVITYNHEKWIAECLDSLLMQETNFDFIIRIYEDCSTDNTAKICKEYKEKYPDKIDLYLSDVNLGGTKNALRSYENIQTPYYRYIEGDDYLLHPLAFQMQVDALEANEECSFCCGITEERYLDFNYICGETPILKAKEYIKVAQMNVKYEIYTASHIRKFSGEHYFSFLLSRVVRTKHIKIDKEYLNFYLTDNSQMYELLKQGNMLYLKEVIGVSRHTGEGFISGKTTINQIKWLVDYLYAYNKYSKGYFDNNIVELIVRSCEYYKNFNVPLKKITYNLTFLDKIQKVKRYFIPRFILDILNIPRNIIRLFRKLRGGGSHMTKQEFLVELEDILQREGPLLESDKLEDYEEWDSLSKMSLMAYYDKNFGVKLSLNSFKNLETVSDIMALAGDKIQ